MGLTEDALRNMGYTIVDGKAIRKVRAGEGSRLGTDAAPAPDARAPHPAKYRNVKCEWQGEKFDSRHEMEDWIALRARETAGEISQLKRQVEFPLYCPVYTDGPAGRVQVGNTVVWNYVADFTFKENGKLIVQDSKGMRTKEYKAKRRHLERQEGIEIRET